MAATRRPARKSTARKSTARKPAAKRSARKSGGSNKSVDRANAALEAAQKAFQDLRTELTKGGSRLLKDAQLRDAEKLLKDAGKTYRSLSKRLVKDLEELQKAATTGKRPTARRSSSSSARKPAAKRASTTRAKPAAKRTATKAKGRAKTTARKKPAAARRSR